jgi:hypothetical protein
MKELFFLYKHSKISGVNADQIEALKRIFSGLSKTMVEPGFDTASKAIKDDRTSRETCRSVIKFLYKNATKGGQNTAVSDVDLGGMIEGAKKCMTQGTKYLNGIVGIQNEINYLQKCNSIKKINQRKFT